MLRTSAAGGSCGCAAGQTPGQTDVRETVRAPLRRRRRAAGPASAAGAAPRRRRIDRRARHEVFGGALYAPARRDGVPDGAVEASLGCGVPTAVADLHEGETVLDLGSGGGADVLISARRVAPTGTAIGLDMTDEMLDLARANAGQGRRRPTSIRSRATSRTSRSPTTGSTS